jgi:hypothetical protein
MIEYWIELGIGVLVLISPWILGFADISLAQWLNVICGAVLVVMNVWMIYGRDPAVEEAPASVPVQKPKRVRRKTVTTVAIDATPVVKSKKIKKVEQPVINI